MDLPLLGQVIINLSVSDELQSFAKRQLDSYIVSENSSSNKTFVLIKVKLKNLEFVDGVFGRQVIFKNNYFEYTKNTKTQNLNFKYYIENNEISIQIGFLKKPLYYLKNIKSSKYSMNHILFYQTILYPIFSLYSMMDNYFLVHGSLIKVNDKYIVLTGLDGVGKSSLTTELALLGHKVLADNFLLFNGHTFVGLNMPIRLDLDNPISENIIYKNDNLKEVLFKDTKRDVIKANKVFFMVIGDELSIKKIDTNTAMLNWTLINNGAEEILAANLFCLPFLYQNMLSLKNSIDENLEFFILSIPKGKIKDGVKEILCQLDI